MKCMKQADYEVKVRWVSRLWENTHCLDMVGKDPTEAEDVPRVLSQ